MRRVGTRSQTGIVTSPLQSRVALCLLLCPAALCTYAQQPEQPRTADHQEASLPEAPDTALRTAETSISGVITDRDGAIVSGCRVVLQLPGHALQRSAISGADGSYTFQGVPPGPFTLTVTRELYAARSISGTVQLEESLNMSPIVLGMAGARADAQVFASRHDVAAEQVRLEEKQRVLGIFPNFYISYIPHPVALTAGQKFSLAARSTIDPVNMALTGVVAGIEQAARAFQGYGQGAGGFGKRYGAGFADGAISTALGGAVLPSLLHQDPRYFWKGEGTTAQRARYAMSRVFVCKGDNGRWQPNYSNVFGNLASAGLSNLYYPSSDRHGAGLTMSNALIGTAGGALANLYQEFFSRRMTPGAGRVPIVADEN